MSANASRPTPEEIGVLAYNIFVRIIRPNLPSEDVGKFLAIDAASGEYEIAPTMMEAVDRLRVLNPAALSFVMRCDGSPAFRMRSPRLRILRDRPRRATDCFG